MCRMKSLSNRCVSVSPPQTGTDSGLSPLRMVRIPRCATRVSPCATLCHPVPPCVSTSCCLLPLDTTSTHLHSRASALTLPTCIVVPPALPTGTVPYPHALHPGQCSPPLTLLIPDPPPFLKRKKKIRIPPDPN